MVKRKYQITTKSLIHRSWYTSHQTRRGSEKLNLNELKHKAPGIRRSYLLAQCFGVSMQSRNDSCMQKTNKQQQKQNKKQRGKKREKHKKGSKDYKIIVDSLHMKK